MDPIRHICSKFNSSILTNQIKLNFLNTFHDLYSIQCLSVKNKLIFPNLTNEDLVYAFRRHRGGKVKNKLRNLEKKKKKEQLLNSTLEKLSKDTSPKSE
ncbi:hypothetical protein TOT_010000807 [Theileria orientalis strain Shintoku]|uniref:Uncharacterized protein n=1 Tax=Theileria orientalis strain Shintoku TaxID=869250 RepID=J4C7N5_THEOR|nr:hypothetical protein TOT_010000807 [Theileria orientalis strain Shintoku]PVC54803.1 hypothetical protein MACL_00003545 [Theileria orientalis]BAM39348.1 hypothetical protein TOT_010000807 [Theileria orientalis strain Shintoku]|eukprot:XP_009689649.1 hypothetical protein TOT_010000807 [Theileria orientalis strain Shintoku]